MVDVHDPRTRSRNMAAVRSSNTKPELALRKALHAEGLRYRLHAKGMPGKPDLIFRKYKAAIFVHGCFWHGHDCHLFRLPKTRTEFWSSKIDINRCRDMSCSQELAGNGWRIAEVWECALKGRQRRDMNVIVKSVRDWLCSDQPSLSITGG